MNRNQYRGKNGRFEKCTVEKCFGIKTNENLHKYRCTKCGDVFVPIIETGRCTRCQGVAEIVESEGADDERYTI